MTYNDLSDDLSSNVKLFTDDISSFSIGYNNKKSANELKIYVGKISNWSDQWYPCSFRLLNVKICRCRNLIFPVFASGQTAFAS